MVIGKHFLPRGRLTYGGVTLLWLLKVLRFGREHGKVSGLQCRLQFRLQFRSRYAGVRRKFGVALPVSERPAHFSCKYRDYCRFDLAVDVCKGILSVELHHGLPHSLCLPQTSRRRASARCERVASF